MSKLVHVEMYDSRMFGGDECDDGGPYVYQGDWHDDPEALKRANCLRCLDAAQRLGSHALKSMNVARRAGETFDAQAAVSKEAREERGRKWRESRGASSGIAAFDAIIKKHYPDGALPEARRLTSDELRNLKKAP